MIDIKTLMPQVQRNCDISDAQYAGHYSVCGLFIRLRDLYKWENGLDPWIEKSPEMLDWIDAKENRWETLAETSLHSLSIRGTLYDPFATDEIQTLISDDRLFYGGGYARGMKPSFFLGEIEAEADIEGISVKRIGHEYARDLFAAPSLVQDEGIVYRRNVAMSHFWDQIFYVTKSGRFPLGYALAKYGCTLANLEKIHGKLHAMVSDMSDRYIYHEVGELLDATFDRKIWREIISRYTHTPVELMARGLKDLLADTCPLGPLKRIIYRKQPAAVGFYVASLDGIVRLLFPEIIAAFNGFAENEDWHLLEAAVDTGYGKAAQYAQIMSGIHLEGKDRKDPDWTRQEMRERVLTPLGI